MIVEALDGSVGQVGELLMDPQSGQVTHFLLMKGHGWGKKEVAIQVYYIDRIEEEIIHLKIDKEKIGQLLLYR
jgi:sporulation protein YlmC with PRC-barrel domain